MGVLVRNAEALEMLEKVDTLVVDKTGTLTEGKPRLGEVDHVAGVAEDDLLRLAASLEQASEHPLAARDRRGCRRARPGARAATAFRSDDRQGCRRYDGRPQRSPWAMRH